MDLLVRRELVRINGLVLHGYYLGSNMSQRVEHNSTNEHHLYMVLFITNGGGI
jgi:hypothetical protein